MSIKINIIAKNNDIVNNITKLVCVDFCDFCDIILIDDFSDKNLIEKSIEIADGTKIIVINADADYNYPLKFNKNIFVLTYGLNDKSVITASSMDEQHVTCCIQRAFKGLYHTIPEQEFKTPLYGNSVHTTLAVLSIFLLLNCVPPE